MSSPTALCFNVIYIYYISNKKYLSPKELLHDCQTTNLSVTLVVRFSNKTFWYWKMCNFVSTCISSHVKMFSKKPDYNLLLTSTKWWSKSNILMLKNGIYFCKNRYYGGNYILYKHFTEMFIITIIIPFMLTLWTLDVDLKMLKKPVHINRLSLKGLIDSTSSLH